MNYVEHKLINEKNVNVNACRNDLLFDIVYSILSDHCEKLS